MRFRAKVSPAAWFYLVGAAFYMWSWATYPHPGLTKFIQAICAVVWILLSAVLITGSFLTYWEIKADGLHERRMGRTRFVPWSDVQYIGAWEKSPHLLNIEYSRPMLNSLPGRILARPVKRQIFLDEIRRFAPQAEFEN
jgi:hypothetical protein